jgi:hypothetical protein
LQNDNPLYQAMWHNSYLRRAYKTLTCPAECELYLPYISKSAWHSERKMGNHLVWQSWINLFFLNQVV